MLDLNSQLRRGSIRLNMMQTSSSSEFLTVAEVADLLKLNPQTIRNMIFSTRFGVFSCSD